MLFSEIAYLNSTVDLTSYWIYGTETINKIVNIHYLFIFDSKIIAQARKNKISF